MAGKEVEVRKENLNRSPSVQSPWGDMNRMMERFFSDPFGSWLTELPSVSRRALADIKETDQGYVLSAEIPGIPKEDLDISVNGNMLTVRAEHKDEEGKADSPQGYRRHYRSFHQSFSLPTTVDPEKIEAACENGLLEIFLPKTEAAQPKKIEVQSGKGTFFSRLNGKKSTSEKGEEEKH